MTTGPPPLNKITINYIIFVHKSLTTFAVFVASIVNSDIFYLLCNMIEKSLLLMIQIKIGCSWFAFVLIIKALCVHSSKSRCKSAIQLEVLMTDLSRGRVPQLNDHWGEE